MGWSKRCGLIVALLWLAGASGAAMGQEKVESDFERYWAGSRDLPVISGGKLFDTARRFELGIYGGILPNDNFYNYFPIGILSGYRFNHTWGVELQAAYLGLKSDTELATFLVERGAGIRKDVDLGDSQVARIDVVGTFSPLYGKWSFQTYKLSHFELFLLLGAGVVIVEEPEIKSGNLDPEPDPVLAVHPEGVIGAGFRFFILDWMALRLDARWYLYPAFDGVSAPAKITLGLSFFTPEL